MALLTALLLCFTLLAISGRLTARAIVQSKSVSDDTSVLMYAMDFFSSLITSWRFWVGSCAGTAGSAIVFFIVVRVGLTNSSAWMSNMLLFFLPALAANQCAGIARALKLPGSAVPVNLRWLGKSKTWGSYYGLIGSLATVLLQNHVAWLQSNSVVYGNSLTLLYGVLMGIGATWGDHAESFLKRRIGIPPAKPWWPWDQTDFAVCSALLVLPLYGLDVLTMLFGFMILMLVMHPIGNFVGYKLGLRDRVL